MGFNLRRDSIYIIPSQPAALFRLGQILVPSLCTCMHTRLIHVIQKLILHHNSRYPRERQHIKLKIKNSKNKLKKEQKIN